MPCFSNDAHFLQLLLFSFVQSHLYFWNYLGGDLTGNDHGGVRGEILQFNRNFTPPAYYHSCLFSFESDVFYGMGGGDHGAQYNDFWQFSLEEFSWRWINGVPTPNPPEILKKFGEWDPLNQPRGKNGPTCVKNTMSENFPSVFVIGGSTRAPGHIIAPASGEVYEFRAEEPFQWRKLKNSSEIEFGTPREYNDYVSPGYFLLATGSSLGDSVFLYGGMRKVKYTQDSYDFSGDLFQYSISKSQWRWLAGPQTMGTSLCENNFNSSSSHPSCRISTSSFVHNNNFHIFGGSGYCLQYMSEYNDLWSLNITSFSWLLRKNNSECLIHKKFDFDDLNQPHKRYDFATTFNNDQFFVYGGDGDDNTLCLLNSLWVLSLSSYQWMFINGSVINTTEDTGIVPDPQYAIGSISANRIVELPNKWIFTVGGSGVTTDPSRRYNTLNTYWIFVPEGATRCFNVFGSDPLVCNGEGKCLESGYCECTNSSFCFDCETPKCFGWCSQGPEKPNVCNSHGVCLGVNRCFCDNYWKYSKDCGVVSCFDVASTNKSVCSSHGVCDWNATNRKPKCVCKDGWTLRDCSQFYCEKICQNGGICDGPNQCLCGFGWIGKWCDVKGLTHTELVVVVVVSVVVFVGSCVSVVLFLIGVVVGVVYTRRRYFPKNESERMSLLKNDKKLPPVKNVGSESRNVGIQ